MQGLVRGWEGLLQQVIQLNSLVSVCMYTRPVVSLDPDIPAFVHLQKTCKRTGQRHRGLPFITPKNTYGSLWRRESE